MKSRLFGVCTITLLFFGLISCEEDFETLDSEITNGQGLDVILNDEVSIVAYSSKLSPVQTNGLQRYQLGIYNDPIYGSTTTNLLTQVSLSSNGPTFGENATLEDVILYIPYYSTALSTDADGATEYRLDSLYGETSIKLEMFESKFLLNILDVDSGFEEQQLYYSDQASTFENFLGNRIGVIDNFIPSAEEIVIPNENEEEDDERIAPGLRFSLNKRFFELNVLQQEGNEVLINNNNFRNFFRGIYFKASSDSADGSLFSMDLSEATITLEYSFDDEDSDTGREQSTYVLNLGGIAVNTFQNNFPKAINQAIRNPDTENGEENLYLKGGEGALGIIELFGTTDVLGYNDNGVVNQPNGVPDELDEIRRNEWIVNEANLIFYVNKDLVTGGDAEPERIVIFDLENSTRLIDFNLDPTIAQTPVVDAASRHLGRLERDADMNGEFYKIRITSHINNLIQNNTENVKLGVMVAHDVLLTDFLELQNVQSSGLESAPEASIQSPEGTILYGNATENEEKRLKLQIFYTDPNQ